MGACCFFSMCIIPVPCSRKTMKKSLHVPKSKNMACAMPISGKIVNFYMCGFMQHGRDRCCHGSSEKSISAFLYCVLSFTTTTFLHLGHFSQELSSGFQQRRSNFLDLPAPLPAPIVPSESLIQFRRLRSFAKQLLWDRCFQQLPNSNRVRVDLHIASKATCSLDNSFFGESSAGASASAKRKTETLKPQS